MEIFALILRLRYGQSAVRIKLSRPPMLRRKGPFGHKVPMARTARGYIVARGPRKSGVAGSTLTEQRGSRSSWRQSCFNINPSALVSGQSDKTPLVASRTPTLAPCESTTCVRLCNCSAASSPDCPEMKKPSPYCSSAEVVPLRELHRLIFRGIDSFSFRDTAFHKERPVDNSRRGFDVCLHGLVPEATIHPRHSSLSAHLQRSGNRGGYEYESTPETTRAFTQNGLHAASPSRSLSVDQQVRSSRAQQERTVCTFRLGRQIMSRPSREPLGVQIPYPAFLKHRSSRWCSCGLEFCISPARAVALCGPVHPWRRRAGQSGEAARAVWWWSALLPARQAGCLVQRRCTPMYPSCILDPSICGRGVRSTDG